MFLAVLICLVTSSLTIFFLFPRPIAVQPAGLNSTIVAFDRADIQLNITVGGCSCPWALTPPSQQYSSVALVQCCDPGHQQPGALWYPQSVRNLGRSRGSHEPHNRLYRMETLHSEGSD